MAGAGMGQEFRPQQFELDGGAAAPAALRPGWGVAGARVPRWPILAGSALFGIAAALAAIFLSGASDTGIPRWSDAAGYWPLSAAVLAIVAAAWLAGTILAIYMLIRLPRWNRDRALFVPGWLGALVAFGFGPLLAALFFAAIGVGAQPGAVTLPALGIAVLVLALFVYAHAAIARFSEALLLSLFLWLAMLALPAYWSDPVSRLSADVLLASMRRAGLL